MQVARGVAALERRLGARLLERTAQGLIPTAPGERARAAAEAAEAAFQEATAAVQGVDGRPSGLVRITATEAIGSAIFIPALATLHEALPDIRLEVVSGYGILDVGRGETDIALRPARPLGMHLAARRLGTVALGVYAAAAYLRRRGAPAVEDRLAGHDVLGYPEVVQPPPPGEPFLGARLAGARLVLAASTPIGLAAAAEAGMGIATLPCYLADGRPGLVRLWPGRAGSYELYAVIRADQRRVLRVRAVLAHLGSCFAAMTAGAPFLAPPLRRRSAHHAAP